MKLWKWLLLFLCPGVDGDDPEGPEDPEEIDDPEDPEDPEEIDDPEDPEDPEEIDDPEDPEYVPPKKETRAQREIRQLRERAQRAEEEAQRLKSSKPAAEPTQQQNEEQQIWQQEEEALNDPNLEPWQRYSIESNRRARRAEAQSRQAMLNAQDMADKSEFNQLKVENPTAYKAYKDRVEETLARMRANGANAPRKEILAFLIGQDALNGKQKSARTTKPKGGVNRGKPPGAQSNVNSSNKGLSEREKRIKRLENVRI